VFAIPDPAASTIRARVANPAATVEDLVSRTSSARSSSLITRPGAGRFAMPH